MASPVHGAGAARKVRDVIAARTRETFSVVSNRSSKEGMAVDTPGSPPGGHRTDDPQAEPLIRELYEPFVLTCNPVWSGPGSS